MTANPPRLLALAYGRQSVERIRDRRDGGSVSIAYQREAAERWCASHDATLAGWFQDLDESGANVNREGIAALIAEAQRVRPQYVLFWDLKRLSRNLRFFLDLFDVFATIGAELVSCTEGTRHPAFVWKLLALVGEEERDRIAVNITHGKRESAKRGRHSGYAPIGYRLTETSELEIDPDTQWIPAWIFARALEGKSPTAICREANEHGIPTPRQRGPWTRTQVMHILTRPTYAGHVESGKASRTRYGKSLPVVRVVGTHEAIIDPASWQTVQEGIAGRSRPSARRGSSHWLAGRVRCAACGSRLYYVDAGRTDSPSRDRYWRCAATYNRTFGREAVLSCPASKRRISDRVVTARVIAALTEVISRQWNPSDILAKMEHTGVAAARAHREAMERELAEWQRQRMRIADAVQFGAGDLADLAARDRELVDRINAAVLDLAATPPEPDQLAITDAVAAVALLAEMLPRADDDARAALVLELGITVAVDLDAETVALAYRDRYAWLARG